MLLLALSVFGLAAAQAKRVTPPRDALTIKAKSVPSIPANVAGGFPPKGTALSGTLKAKRPACEGNRLLTGVFEFSRHDNEPPLERSLGVWTKPSGNWSTRAVDQFYSFEDETVRVHAVAERVRLASGATCPEVESPTLTVHNHQLSVCDIETYCREADRLSNRAQIYRGSLTVKAKEVRSPYPPEAVAIGYPETATVFYGRLQSESAACERHRRITFVLRFPPSYEPLIRDFKDETDAKGHYETELGPGYSTEPKIVRVVAVAKRKSIGHGRVCARVESPETNIRQHPINRCAIESNCGVRNLRNVERDSAGSRFTANRSASRSSADHGTGGELHQPEGVADRPPACQSLAFP